MQRPPPVDITTLLRTSSQQNKGVSFRSQSASRGAVSTNRSAQRDGNSAFNVETLTLYKTDEYLDKLVDVRRKRVRWTAEEEKA